MQFPCNAITILMMALLVMAAGCKSKPLTPPPAPRPEPVNTQVLDQMVQSMAQKLVTDLIEHPTIKNAEYQKALAVGPIEVNGFAEPERFSTGLENLRGTVMTNKALTKRVRMLPTQHLEAESILKQYSGGSGGSFDPTGRATDDTETQPLHPDDLLIMSGRFSLMHDNAGTKYYDLTVTVNHPRTGTVVFNERMTRRFAWDSDKAIWTTSNCYPTYNPRAYVRLAP